MIGVFAYPKAPVEPALVVQYSLEQNPPFDRADLRAEVLFANDGNFVVLKKPQRTWRCSTSTTSWASPIGRPAWPACQRARQRCLVAASGRCPSPRQMSSRTVWASLAPEAFAATLYQQVLGKGAGTPGLAEASRHRPSVYTTYGAGSALSIFAGALGEVEAAKLLTPGFQAIGQGVTYTVMTPDRRDQRCGVWTGP